MHVRAPLAALHAAMSTAAHSAGGSIGNLATSIHLEVKAGKATFTGFNIETLASVAIDVDGADGQTVVPIDAVRYLGELGKVGDGNLKFTERSVTVSGHGVEATFDLPGTVEDWPDLPTFSGVDGTVTLTSSAMSSLSAAASAAAGRTAPANSALRGVLLAGLGDDLAIVGTDSYRLAYALERLSEPTELSVVVPSDVAALAARLLSKAEKVTFRVDGAWVSFAADNVTLAGRRLEVSFPDWQRVVPTVFTSTVGVARAKIDETLRRVAVLADDSRVVTLTKENGSLTAACTARGRNTSETISTVVGIGEDFADVAVNVDFVKAAISSIKGDVAFHYVDPTKPIVVSGGEPKKAGTTIMVIRRPKG